MPNCPYCEVEMVEIDREKHDICFECPNDKCTFLAEGVGAYYDWETDEDRALEEADYDFDCAREANWN